MWFFGLIFFFSVFALLIQMLRGRSFRRALKVFIPLGLLFLFTIDGWISRAAFPFVCDRYAGFRGTPHPVSEGIVIQCTTRETCEGKASDMIDRYGFPFVEFWDAATGKVGHATKVPADQPVCEGKRIYPGPGHPRKGEIPDYCIKTELLNEFSVHKIHYLFGDKMSFPLLSIGFMKNVVADFSKTNVVEFTQYEEHASDFRGKVVAEFGQYMLLQSRLAYYLSRSFGPTGPFKECVGDKIGRPEASFYSGDVLFIDNSSSGESK